MPRRGQLRRERPDHTLQPTALVHEAYLRAVDQRQVDWQGRAHFFGVAALGGIATSFVLTVLLAPQLTPLTRGESLVAGFFLPLAGFLGDVSVSAIKRDIGVKDAGSIIPGHGGVLDRVNSLTFTAPLFFHFLRYLHF